LRFWSICWSSFWPNFDQDVGQVFGQDVGQIVGQEFGQVFGQDFGQVFDQDLNQFVVNIILGQTEQQKNKKGNQKKG
jgi:hypothetical protein